MNDLTAKKRVMRVELGPCTVPIVPVSSFSRIPEGIDRYALWRLIGPTVGRNIDKPLWLQFCAVYLEGLNHGAGLVEETRNA